MCDFGRIKKLNNFNIYIYRTFGPLYVLYVCTSYRCSHAYHEMGDTKDDLTGLYLPCAS